MWIVFPFCILVGAVTAAGSNIVSFATSDPIGNKTWSMMRVEPALSNVDSIKSSAECVQQIQF